MRSLKECTCVIFPFESVRVKEIVWRFYLAFYRSIGWFTATRPRSGHLLGHYEVIQLKIILAISFTFDELSSGFVDNSNYISEPLLFAQDKHGEYTISENCICGENKFMKNLLLTQRLHRKILHLQENIQSRILQNWFILWYFQYFFQCYI